MTHIRHAATRLIGALLASGLMAATPALAQEDTGVIDDKAVDTLRTSMSFLGNLPAFALETHSTIEVVLETGQKLQFDYEIAATIKRPDKLFAERLGGLVDNEFFYDGQSLTLHYPDEGFYATVEAPPTIDAMLDFAMQELDIAAPAGDFIYTNAFDLLMADVQSAFVLEEPVYLAGAECDHLAFSAPGTDFQVWIERGDRPLPRKLVITSRDILNAPQYTVYIREWNLAPDVSDELFRFNKPEKARRIEFITLGGGAN